MWWETKKAVKTANDTFGEVQKQTNLMRNQLEGTQAAVTNVSTPEWEFGEHRLHIAVTNEGSSIATDVRLTFIATKRTIQGKIIGEPKPGEYYINSLQAKAGRNPSWAIPWMPASNDPRDFGPWWPGFVIFAEGDLRYNNAFRDRVEHFCWAWLPPARIGPPNNWSIAGGRFEGGSKCDVTNIIAEAMERDARARKTKP
jgi:hypothetical protein